jgi:hypothetical protein
MGDIAPLEKDATCRQRYPPQDGAAGGAFPGPRLADQSKRLTGHDRKRHIFNRMNLHAALTPKSAAARIETHGQALRLDQRTAISRYILFFDNGHRSIHDLPEDKNRISIFGFRI